MIMPKIRVYVDERYPTYYIIPDHSLWSGLGADEIELTDSELATIHEAERLYSEAQMLLRTKVKELGQSK